jgi:chemotaxis protein methyltransferase CheR
MDQADRLEELVARRAGLHLREQERATLLKIARARVQKLRLGAGQTYVGLLEGGGAAAEAEWAHIFTGLTNNETYFFRDAGQMALLSERILPDLIRRNAGTRSLRLWSAGCSTGEEPYSLAILIDELLPDRKGWDVRILGTDLSEEALAKARRAVYGPWSFRATSEARRKAYFEMRLPTTEPRGFGMRPAPPASGERLFTLAPRIRDAVTLQPGNLASDAFPSLSSGIHDMDLILCRNVFIYFGREAVASVLEKFARSLRPEGFLLTGHAELQVPLPRELQTRNFPQTIIYQRATGTSQPPTPAAPLTRSNPAPATAGASTWKFETPAPSPAPIAPPAPTVPPAPTAPIAPTVPVHASAQPERAGHSLLEQAQAAADAGRYDVARELCRGAINENALSAAPHQLLASIALEMGDHETAKAAWKKAIYLAPGLVWPYIELDALYRREGDAARARTMRRAALQVLESLPPQSAVPTSTPEHPAPADITNTVGNEASTVSELIEHLKAIG